MDLGLDGVGRGSKSGTVGLSRVLVMPGYGTVVLGGVGIPNAVGLFTAIEIAGDRGVVVEVAELPCVMWVPSAADISGWVAAGPAGDGGFKGEIAAEVSDIFWLTSGMAGS